MSADTEQIRVAETGKLRRGGMMSPRRGGELTCQHKVAAVIRIPQKEEEAPEIDLV